MQGAVNTLHCTQEARHFQTDNNGKSRTKEQAQNNFPTSYLCATGYASVPMLGRALAEPVAPGKPEKLNREVISDLFPTRQSRNQESGSSPTRVGRKMRLITSKPLGFRRSGFSGNTGTWVDFLRHDSGVRWRQGTAPDGFH